MASAVKTEVEPLYRRPWRSGDFAKALELDSLLPRASQRIGITLSTSKLFAIGVLALGLCFGTTIVRSQRQSQTFFKTKIGLSESDIQEMDQGHVVTKVLESADKKYEVVVFGGVHIRHGLE